MAPADNIRQRDQRVIRKFEKKKGRHRKMKKNVKRLIAGAVVLLVAAGIVVRIAGGNKKEEDYETFLSCITTSGNSACKWLQN